MAASDVCYRVGPLLPVAALSAALDDLSEDGRAQVVHVEVKQRLGHARVGVSAHIPHVFLSSHTEDTDRPIVAPVKVQPVDVGVKPFVVGSEACRTCQTWLKASLRSRTRSGSSPDGTTTGRIT